MRKVEENLAKINDEINQQREKSNISTQPSVIAVTKYVTIERA
ncbi:YggS family pyridoxal phosphate enzyme, partial [Staphylococcus saprophyticus]